MKKDFTLFIRRSFIQLLKLSAKEINIMVMIATAMITIIFTSEAQDTWTQKADFGGGIRAAAVGFSIGDKGYIGTGDDGTFNFKKDFWEYDPDLNAWSQKADFGGTIRWGAVGFSIGSKGYLGTGYIGVNAKDFWEYDSDLNTWTQKADFGGAARRYAVGFSIGNKGYIGTGDDGTFNSKKDFWEYDPDLDTWVQKVDFGGDARKGAVGFSIGDKGYIGTGNSSTINKKDFWEYDPDLDTWTQKADFGGTIRYTATGFSIGSKGYLGTGYNSGAYFKDLWEYDPDLDIWTQKADFGGTIRTGAVGLSIGSRGYIGTGYFIFYEKDFWEYTPADSCINASFPSVIAAPVSFCTDSSVVLTIDGGYLNSATDWQWYEGSCGGAVAENGSSVTLFPDSTTTYYVRGEGGCVIPQACASIMVSLAYEVCNGLDDDCDGIADNGLILSTYYADNDNDGFGNVSNSVDTCALPSGFVTDSTDCDDTYAAVNPDTIEILNNSIDDNCDGYVDEFGVGISLIDQSENHLTVFPNPAKGKFRIKLKLNEGIFEDATIALINLPGQVIALEIAEIVNGKLDHVIQLTNEEAEGIYMVQVKIKGKIFATQIIVRNKSPHTIK